MGAAPIAIKENYWDEFSIQEDDIEFLYSYLLEVESPKTPDELLAILVEERIRREIKAAKEQVLSGGDIYLPKGHFKKGQKLVFPALGWKKAKVI
ncbi:MAG: hypothetical protein J7L73_02460, partial [Anaerolineales bacterium]|nr:hypothetical protein [Anaerolineales bacterium]